MLKRIAILIVGLAVSSLLVLLCAPRIAGDFGLMRAKTAITAALVQNALSPAEYAAAADALKDVQSSNGEALINRAEMVALQSGDRANLSRARALVVQGLTHSPVEPRGWTLLCEIDFHLDPRRGADCMDTALFIAPYDWFSAGRRGVLAGNLYPLLTPLAQAAAARRIRMMWYSDIWPDHRVRNSLYAVFISPYGPPLIESAFRQDRDGLRELNRWALFRRIYGAP